LAGKIARTSIGFSSSSGGKSAAEEGEDDGKKWNERVRDNQVEEVGNRVRDSRISGRDLSTESLR
jgi:hypothetical protein